MQALSALLLPEPRPSHLTWRLWVHSWFGIWNVRRKCSAAVSMFGGTSIRHLFFTITSLPLHCDNYWIVNYYYFSLFTEIAAELFAGHSNSKFTASFGPEISVQAVCKRLFICFLFAVFSPLQLQLQGSMSSCVFQFYFPLLEPRFITSTLVVTVSVVPTWKQYRIGTTRAY